MLNSVNGQRKSSGSILLIGCFVIVVFTLITFYPASKIGFYGDDWWQVANVGRKSLSEFLRFYFDPSLQTIWYRPAHGLLLLAEYQLFGSSPEGYHFVYALIHLTNSLLLFIIVHQISGRWRLGLLSAILYAGMFPGSVAVFGIAVHDPLATLFYLLTILFWFRYLTKKHWLDFLIAIGMFLLALLSKETNASLIAIMFFSDRLFVARKADLREEIRLYGIFALILAIYAIIEYRIQVQGHFSNQEGYSIGFHVIENIVRYLTLLMWPWGWNQSAALAGFVLAVALFTLLFLQMQFTKLNVGVLLFLSSQILLAIAPVVSFPGVFFEQRYLYLASIGWSILIALLFERMGTALTTRRFPIVFVPILVVMLSVGYSFSTAESAIAMAEFNRESRVPFRDIVQLHPVFPSDTYLYFIDPPYLLKHAAPSMFFLRYGYKISIWSVDPQWWGTLDEDRFAALRDHRHSFVYYYDDAQQRHEIAVNPISDSVSIPPLPLDYQVPIRLEGYELTSTKLARGEALLLLLYWQGKGNIEKDYSVFVHLVDNNGQQIIGSDGRPQKGAAPTNYWKKDKLVVDPHILLIPYDMPISNPYHLEIGLYYLPTGERVQAIDQTGQGISDTLIIQPINIVE